MAHMDPLGEVLNFLGHGSSAGGTHLVPKLERAALEADLEKAKKAGLTAEGLELLRECRTSGTLISVAYIDAPDKTTCYEYEGKLYVQIGCKSDIESKATKLAEKHHKPIYMAVENFDPLQVGVEAFRHVYNTFPELSQIARAHEWVGGGEQVQVVVDGWSVPLTPPSPPNPVRVVGLYVFEIEKGEEGLKLAKANEEEFGMRPDQLKQFWEECEAKPKPYIRYALSLLGANHNGCCGIMVVEVK